MKRKSPGYIELMAHSRNSADIPRARDIRTASSLFMTREERESLGSAMDYRALGLVARRERDKFARQDSVLEKFRETYFRAREKLAATINKNQALMELRHELQQRRRAGEEPASQASNRGEVKLPLDENNFNHVELRY
ncbi:MAG: hypothetical protein Q8O55_06695 [Dehalococcoidales bacterium]|nr:hypothetical protein [Dehalococcoidales bacterium]